MKWKYFAGLFIIAGLTGCGQSDGKNKEEKEESVETVLPTEETVVYTETLRTVDFEHELVSNGRISAQQVAELQFASASSAGNVPVRIFVKNGDHVVEGDAIAMLDTFQISNSYRQAEDNLQKAYLELQDVLIGQGYAIGDSAAIPPEMLRLACIRSGYNSSKIQYDLAKYNLDNAVLRTPIAGTVTNLFSKPYCAVNTAEPFCTVINEGKPEVDFNILENELPLIQTGDRVMIQSYASPDIESTGNIANINPSVDKEGTVRVKAYVRPHPKIFNGMNVRISVFRSLGQQWVIPKSAVVLRTGKQVVFVYKDGQAAWNYVTTGLENATHYTVTSKTLQEGDEIIINGNEHLADGTNVKKADD
ncbi:MAG: efflux RND transporter periplasmic adaptor subunit [Tannerella sp.]|jgi:RND family efflux transporter MFP subunit|nr:efflux RND transporter periplasmic adaptor subunit [Tannerella sp.]